MAKMDRKGNRKKRGQGQRLRVPELGYYLIVTDTEATERCYFSGLYRTLPDNIKNRLVIKVVETKTHSLVEMCKEEMVLNTQYRMPWIVFDRDQVKDFDEIVGEAEKNGIQVGWSNPCFEMWMYAYFGGMPTIQDSLKCCAEFGKIYRTKTGQNYSKSNEQIYDKLSKYGDEKEAIRLAQRKHYQHMRDGKSRPSQMCPCTTVYELVDEIKKKAE